jgi:putative ABC transport system substrate-binding protein
MAAFVRGLKDTGFIEGNNINIEWRWAEGQYNRLPSLAGELISRGVAVIVAFDAPAAAAAKAATKTIPIVFVTGADPVKTGLVDSFSRPGGNLTGVFVLISMLGPKRLELLRELLPSTTTIALLVNPSNPNVVDAPETEAAANAIGRRLEVLTASTEGDLEAAFTTRPPFSGRPSLTGHCGHCWTCSLPRPVAHDPTATSTRILCCGAARLPFRC